MNEKKERSPRAKKAKKEENAPPSLKEKCREFYRLTGGVWFEKRLFTENGIPVLSWEGSFPAPDDGIFGSAAAARRVRELYAEMALAAARRVRDEALAAAVASLRASGDGARYRFRRFSLRHTAEMRVAGETAQESEGEARFFCVHRRLMLLRGGRVIFEEEREERFSLTNGMPLSVRKKRTESGKKSGSPKCQKEKDQRNGSD